MFKLHSKFKPRGDQPQAIKKLTRGLKKGFKHQVLLGVTGSGKTFTMANIIALINKPTLVISHNKTLAAQLASEFKDFFPENAVHYFVSYYDYYQPEAYLPSTDTYIEKEATLNEEIDRLRHATTQALLSRSDTIIVASVSCIYGLGSPEEYRKVRLTLREGERRERDLILCQLINLQYKRNDHDFHRGTFRVRGDALEIFPVSSLDYIYRIEFFEDKIEKISVLDSLTRKLKPSLSPLASRLSVDIYPATHYIAPQERFKLALNQIREELALRLQELKKQGKLLEVERLERKTNYDLEMLEETGYCQGIENYSRYFDSRSVGEPPYTLLDYFPLRDWLLFIDESHMTIPQITGMYAGDHSRKETLVEYGFRLSSALDNRPLNFKEFEKRTNQVIYVSATPGPYEKLKIKNAKGPSGESPSATIKMVEQVIRPTGLLDPTIAVRPTKNQIDDLTSEIQKRVKKHQRVLVTTLTKRMAEELAEYLAEIGIKVHYLHSEIETFERLEILRSLRVGEYDVVVGINLLREGLDLPEVSLVAILDADKEGYLRSDRALIQTMGRASRHKDGHVIMYADTLTGSMKKAIRETKRRRKIQEAYNKKHGITPRSIIKEIREDRLAGAKLAPEVQRRPLKDIPPEEISRLVHDLKNQMDLAARNLEFEKAAILRDQIRELRKLEKSTYQ